MCRTAEPRTRPQTHRYAACKPVQTTGQDKHPNDSRRHCGQGPIFEGPKMKKPDESGKNPHDKPLSMRASWKCRHRLNGNASPASTTPHRHCIAAPHQVAAARQVNPDRQQTARSQTHAHGLIPATMKKLQVSLPGPPVCIGWHEANGIWQRHPLYC